MIDRDFEKFLGGPTQPVSQRLHVTINKENVIGLNENCYRQLGNPPGVFLHFSRSRDMIAVEPVQSLNQLPIFPVKRKTSVGWRINASTFCKHFNIRLDATHRFNDPEINGDGKLLLKLAQTTIVRQIRRTKKL